MENSPAPVYIFGLGLEHEDAVIPQLWAHSSLESVHVLVGGKRQLAFFEEHPAEKIEVGKDIPPLLERIKKNRDAGLSQAVLCSGDPLYFSLGGRIAAYLREREPEAEAPVRIMPGTSSLQAAAALLGIAWEHVRSVSLHGRGNWLPLAHALASGEHIFLLTDAASTPEAIAAFLWERGYDEYIFHILDNLYINAASGTVDAEARQCIPMAGLVQCVTPEGAAAANGYGSRRTSGANPATGLRVIFLERENRPCKAGFTAASYPEADTREPHADRDAFGLADGLVRRDGDVLTKLPVRSAGLGILSIAPDHVVWDLGAGSGAVSIEAGKLAWRGKVLAVEKNKERIGHIYENRRTFRAVNLEIVHGSIQDVLAVAHARNASGNSSGDINASSSDSEKRSESTVWVENFLGGLDCRPHRIFVGGGLSGGDAAHILRHAWELLLPGGALLAHCVLLGSLELARRVLEELGGNVRIYSLHAGESRPLAGDAHLAGMNPVFLVYAGKE